MPPKATAAKIKLTLLIQLQFSGQRFVCNYSKVLTKQ